jgi:hypothetical protein
MSDKNLEQRINITFWMKTGKSVRETLALLTLAYGEYAMKKSIGFESYRWSKEGREAVQGDLRSGQQKCKGQMQMWTEYEPWRSYQRLRCEPNSRRRLRESSWWKSFEPGLTKDSQP